MEKSKQKRTFAEIVNKSRLMIAGLRNNAAEVNRRGIDASFITEYENELQELEKLGYGNLPVCMAKTQYSLSDDPQALGCPQGFTLNIREVQIAAGAGFVIAITGTIMKMPGLPKVPAANNIDVDKDGNINGLF